MSNILKKISKCNIWIPIVGIVLCILASVFNYINMNINTDLFSSDEFNKYFNLLKDFCWLEEKTKPIFIFIFLLCIAIIGLKKYFKNDTIKILFVNTFKNNNSKINTRYINEDIYSKDISKEVEVLTNDYKKYNTIVERIDNISREFMEAKEYKFFAYGGIMHTPLILRLGYQLGDETYFKLLHKKRDEHYFKLLKDNKTYIGNYPKMNVEKELKQSNELIVSIATTFEITKEKLKKFDIDKKNYIKFETKEKGFDIITSEEQVNQYKRIIFDEIRSIYKQKDIKIIHLCISSSVAFTFALGQGFSRNYDPEVIIYNYEKQEYIWGLKLFEKSEDSIIDLQNILDEPSKSI